MFRRRLVIIKIVAAVWSYGVILAALPLAGWGRYTNEKLHRCSIDTFSRKQVDIVYNYSLLAFGYGVPIACTITCFMFIKIEFQKMSRNGSRNQGRNSSLVQDTLRRERSLTLMFALMTFSFVVAWTPYAVCLFYQQQTGNQIEARLIDASAYFGKSSTVFNPIVYSMVQKNFNTTLKAIFGKCCCIWDSNKNNNEKDKRSDSVFV